MAELDEKDRKIIGLLQENPCASQSDVAAAADLSQPAVSLRIRRLTEQGFISHSIGMDVRRLNLSIAKLEVALKDSASADTLSRCPYIVDMLRMTDTTRLSLFMVGETKSTIDSLVSRLQERDGMDLLHYDTIDTAQTDLIHPLPVYTRGDGECPHCTCASCSHHQEGRCMGCPLTSFYRGELW